MIKGGDVGSETTLQIEEEDLIFRYIQTTEIGCSRSVASYDEGERIERTNIFRIDRKWRKWVIPELKLLVSLELLLLQSIAWPPMKRRPI